MKAIRYIFVFAIMALLLAACGEDPLVIEEKQYEEITSESTFNNIKGYLYLFQISVRDTAGNDLLAPLGEEYYRSNPKDNHYYNEIDPVKYHLNIKGSDGIFRPIQSPYIMQCDEQHNRRPAKEDGTYEGKGIWYLSIDLEELSFSVRDTITLGFQCRTIFGDDSFHDVFIFWEEVPHQYKLAKFEQYPVCTKAVLEGREFLPAKNVFHYFENTEYARDIDVYFLDFVLDK